MLEYKCGNTTAMIVLHEIYGINDFITERCQQYHEEGYDVFCPNLLCGRAAFPYIKSEEAYHVYMNQVGFDAYQEINEIASNLKRVYAKLLRPHRKR